MRTPRLLPTVTGLTVTALLVLSGCGEDGSAAEPRTDGAAAWTGAAAPVDPSGLVWAADGAVHLGDGTVIDTEQQIEAYVVAGDGVYLVPAGDHEGPGAPLLLATEDRLEETGARVEPDTLRTSPDGRYLAFIDPATGEQDAFGTPVATAVVVDTVRGEEVVRSSEGMGDVGEDDLADLYEDAESPEVLGLTDTTAYVAGPDGVRAHDLASGEGSVVADSASEVYDTDWFAALRGEDALTNPAGTWRIVDPTDGSPVRLVPEGGGAPVVTRSPVDVYELDSWLDDETAVGGGLDGETDLLLACTLPTGECAPPPGVPAGALLPVDRSGPGLPTVRR
ncbi:hypothetical protein GGQ22_14555 [Nocardioides sp. zg-579]|uniref:Uncharacterized protein n=1 Tax=Nocardioides marmotae TaxID=2663857 RepID=A0A6I3JDX5_9ACTN|nr:hypothetical protein [Nocardioides marmotae]MCR6032646.1 hypothetical protein [Gordonia jinghuaiqii]MTB96295.1 hypothetical protein [Nocardioides marmotae]QKE03215.1 hypothetical protein HPC71_20745 [Nocardioides marmotae]